MAAQWARTAIYGRAAGSGCFGLLQRLRRRHGDGVDVPETYASPAGRVEIVGLRCDPALSPRGRSARHLHSRQPRKLVEGHSSIPVTHDDDHRPSVEQHPPATIAKKVTPSCVFAPPRPSPSPLATSDLAVGLPNFRKQGADGHRSLGQSKKETVNRRLPLTQRPKETEIPFRARPQSEKQSVPSRHPRPQPVRQSAIGQRAWSQRE